MAAFGPAVAGDGLTVGDARQGGRGLHAVLSLQLFQDHVEMDVAQPRDDQLMGLLHPLHVERRILLGEARQPARDLLLVASGLGGDGEAVRRRR